MRVNGHHPGGAARVGDYGAWPAAAVGAGGERGVGSVGQAKDIGKAEQI